MFSEVLKEVTGVFDRSFLLNAFFPCFTFWGLLGIISVLGLRLDPIKLIEFWNQLDILLKTVTTIGLLAIVVFSATLISSQSGSILRFFEGYWDFPGSSYFLKKGRDNQRKFLLSQNIAEQLREKGQLLYESQKTIDEALGHDQVAKLKKQHKKLEAQVKQLEVEQFLFQNSVYRDVSLKKNESRVMPTRLGNILKSAELYPYDRYHIDAVLIWSRLYHLLPERYTQIIIQARSNLDFALVISTLSILFSIISALFLLAVSAPSLLFLTSFWGGTLVAWLAYNSALGSATNYVEQIRVCFDLYRRELLLQLGLKAGSTFLNEQQQWLEICQLFAGGTIPLNWDFIERESKKKEN
jgi:hypothetical protein